MTHPSSAGSTLQRLHPKLARNTVTGNRPHFSWLIALCAHYPLLSRSFPPHHSCAIMVLHPRAAPPPRCVAWCHGAAPPPPTTTSRLHTPNLSRPWPTPVMLCLSMVLLASPFTLPPHIAPLPPTPTPPHPTHTPTPTYTQSCCVVSWWCGVDPHPAQGA